MKSVRLALTCLALAASPLAMAAQPNMEAALDSLNAAKASLQKATADKGGHRMKAMKAIDTAIAETKAGIEYDRKVNSGAKENRK